MAARTERPQTAAIPALRLNGAAEVSSAGGARHGSAADVSYSDDDDFIDEEIEGSAGASSVQRESSEPAIPAAATAEYGEYISELMTSREPEADRAPARGRPPPDFPARPGSPQPPIQSPVPSPGRVRGKGGKGAQAALDEDRDASMGYPGTRERAARERAVLDEGPAARLGSSAPQLRARSDTELLRGQSESEEEEQGPQEHEGEPDQQQAQSYPSYSWRETLSRFPSLLRLYPLAASSEAALEDPASEQGGGQGGSNFGPVDALEGNEEYLNSHPGSSTQGLQQQVQPPPTTPQPAAQAHVQQTSPPRSAASGAASSTPRQPPSNVSEQMAAEWQAAQTMRPASAIGTSGPSVPCTPTRSVPAGPERVQATPRTAPPRGAWSRRPGALFGGTGSFDGTWTMSDDPREAWAEVEHARRVIEQRARDLDLREAALRRAEARNAGAERQLGELRRRLEDYSEELEEGMVALTAQQSAAREERRHAAELQARARRMYAMMRDTNGTSKMRDWERWSPPGAPGGT
eukprot:TRINITY_DN7072_c0_g1_i2.p1 TRINITY_DN7072_c0_g1~~TRINITY_DN7072_c0_g1_i2.p1  ORF type:complete len:522 (+),score=106.18 TRINITY_DN7072_c0_g1_i2:19-1584(+)